MVQTIYNRLFHGRDLWLSVAELAAMCGVDVEAARRVCRHLHRVGLIDRANDADHRETHYGRFPGCPRALDLNWHGRPRFPFPAHWDNPR